MQAAGHRDADDFVIVWGEDGGELANAFGIAAFGEADEKFAADPKYITALERAGKSDVFEFARLADGLRQRGGFGAARFGAKGENDGDFVKDDGGILNEHGVGKIWFGGKRNNISAECFEELFVSVMLGAGDFEVDRLARNKAELAIDDGGTDGARDGGEHVGRLSLHENCAED
jgi:hypothetical protein